MPRQSSPAAHPRIHPKPETSSSPTWTSLGPNTVLTPNYGAITGRVSALALDPSDPTGNRLYVGTTGGGVWVAQNAAVANAAQVAFTPLTDSLSTLSGAEDPSISIGALTVQPGGTGVILAGTGDPNDALDSYYGAGVLRSADNGNSWTLIPITADNQFAFTGEGFAGFAWSTVNPQLVVAAVSQAYEGTLVNAVVSGRSFQGLYYSTDAGLTWNLATIADGGSVVQGPAGIIGAFDGNAATSVVWNPVRKLFIAAVRFHGYYQSTNGISWSRLTTQPGTTLSTQACPANSGTLGSIACPIFRGAVAVNPYTGDTFTWTVDIDNQDQGLWQDACAISGSACTELNIAFGRQWDTVPLQSDTSLGAATINNGDYNLALAAVPYALGQGEDTWLLAGANDLWRCSLAAGCVWRNTTNTTTCMSGQVAEFQHALTWSTANPLEILIGNDGGLWRSLDAIDQTGAACDPSDATHFQNLNGGLGSLADVESLAGNGVSAYVMMAALGVNGTAGLKAATARASQWPQVLDGYGGAAVIDTRNPANWYVNNQSGVAIYVCSNPTSCTSTSFGASPVITDADVGGDGDTMPSPAPFMIDPVDPTQLLIGTCRLWRGPASGVGWASANAISPIFDSGATDVSCSGDALIRSIAALPISGGKEVIYVGTYGYLNNGSGLPGHVLSATIDPSSNAMPVWSDLSSNPVTNSADVFNQSAFDISSLFVDTHEPTGNTVYATVEGFSNSTEQAETVYRSIDGGAHWASIEANLPHIPVSAVVVDPQSAGTVYVATDVGVFFTSSVASCAVPSSTCWSVFGTGMPATPVVALMTSSASAPTQVLTAATYGRGIWQTPLTAVGQNSDPQPILLTNSGDLALESIAVTTSGNFAADNSHCGTQLAGRSACSIYVTFTPAVIGSQTGTLSLSDALRTQVIPLAGTGAKPATLTVSPTSLTFAAEDIGIASTPQTLTITNTGQLPAATVGFALTGPGAASFTTVGSTCGASLASTKACTVQVVFTPINAGGSPASLNISSATLGVLPVIIPLNGSGNAAAGLNVSPPTLAFAATVVGSASAAQTVTISNTSTNAAAQLNIVATPAPIFTVAPVTCTASLAANASCTVGVVFAPAATGAATGVLTVSSSTIGNVATVALSGRGAVSAGIAVAPSTLTFASTGVGQTSAPTTVTVTNTGSLNALNNLVLGASAGFTVTGNTCPATLGPGLSCTAQVEFTPTVAGAQTGVLSATSTTLPTGASTALQGNGFDFTVNSSGSATQTVAAGKIAAYTLVLTPLANSAGTFTLVCDSIPQNALCTFDPTTEKLNSGVTGNVSLSISTGSLTTSLRLNPSRPWTTLPLLCGLLLLPLWRRHSKFLHRALMLALLAFAIANIAACTKAAGGGSGSGSGKVNTGDTPPGTYSIPVTVTSTGVSHTLTLTLVVD